MKQFRYRAPLMRQFFMQGDGDEQADVHGGGVVLPMSKPDEARPAASPRRPVVRRMAAGYRCVRRADTRHAAPRCAARNGARWRGLVCALRRGVDRYGYYAAVGICALMVCAGVAVGLGGGVRGGTAATPEPAPRAEDVRADAPVQQTSAGLTTGAQASPEPRPRLAMWPLEGELLTDHVTDALIYLPTLAMYGTHEGIDIAGGVGQAVVACADGVVADCWRESLLGNVVELRCEGGVTLRYAGLNTPDRVSVGARVRAGDVIGAVGMSAMSESALAPHLHFEVLVDGESVPPTDWLP